MRVCECVSSVPYEATDIQANENFIIYFDGRMRFKLHNKSETLVCSGEYEPHIENSEYSLHTLLKKHYFHGSNGCRAMCTKRNGTEQNGTSLNRNERSLLCVLMMASMAGIG